MTDQNQLGAEEMNYIGDLFPGFAFGGDNLYCHFVQNRWKTTLLTVSGLDVLSVR